ncbi:class III poly(R)-hydroxyalkanoic acid synthase subunit PhaC [archaeon]|nr:class III poly(R)-hydroxyalkanoic acid synthase subunit PhaC [archaeon]
MEAIREIDIGTTPHEVVYEEDKLKLLHYHPTVKKTHPVPLLVVYALVNRQYMLDLQPDRSIIKKLLDEGFDLYMIDWGYPTLGDKFLTLDDYVNGYIDNVVNVVKRRSGTEKITLMGVCQGGTFSVMYSALHPENVKNLITLVTPIDFDTDKGLLNIWSRNLDVDKVVDTLGNVPGEFLNTMFLLMNPVRLLIDKYVGFAEKMDDEEFVKNFLRMEKWIFDSPDQAGEAYRQFIKDCYQKNLLIKNEMEIGGRLIDLRKIDMPVLNVYAEYDHLVPPDSSKPLTDAISSKDKDILAIPSGHIGIFVGSKSQKVVCPEIVKWLKPRSTIKK